MHVPFGHVCGKNECEEFRCHTLFKIPLHVSKAFLRVLEVPLLFVNQVVTVEEVLLHEDVNSHKISLVRPPIINFAWEGSRFVVHVCFICLQETGQLCELLGPLPMVDEVFQRSQELDDLPLDLGPQLISLSKEADEMFIHAQISRIDDAVDLWCVLYTMLVNVENELLEVLPGWQTELHLLLSGSRCASRCFSVVNWSRCA